ncbi:ATP-binding protein [Desertivirga xinjiangensis]|uniref:ATP-binding protein n=1 Tax=Desertivirga xinjiangensis TaxID=539206 RepID=UPI00210DC89D|nr:ATP-binding protein [Pedobacter xinjiangensis]
MKSIFESEQSLVEVLPIPACVASGAGFFITAANGSMLGLWGWKDLKPETSLKEVYPHIAQHFDVLEDSRTCAPSSQTHETKISVLVDGKAVEKHLSYSLKRFRLASGDLRLLITAEDITEQVTRRFKLEEAERRHAFLLRLSDTLRPLADAPSIQTEASRILGEYLQISRVGYGEVEQNEQRYFTTEYSWTDGTVPPYHGTHDLAGFGPDVLQSLRSGTALVIDDMLEDPRTASPAMQAAFQALQFRSVITASLIKQGRLVAALYVHHHEARQWTEEEKLLVQDVAERTWAAVQRASAERNLRESEEKFRTLFNSIDEGFCVIEVLYKDNVAVDLRYLLANPAFESHSGMASVEGKSLIELLGSVDSFWLKAYDELVQTGKPVRIERYSEPLNRWMSVFSTRIGDQSTRQVAVVFNDITEQKHSEQLKNDFISMVSHELKTPLTSLNAHLQVLNRNSKKQNDLFTSSSIEKSLVQVGRMHRLIQGFLDVARFEEGKIYLNNSLFDLNELVQETREELLLINRSHEIILNLTPTPVTISGDRDKLGQVLINLLSNAVKYSREGSRVEISSEVSGGLSEIKIKDEGIGIKPEYIDKIFKRFYRIEEQKNKHISGFGIGLYLCAEIIKLHKGSINVCSEEGKGSTFIFSLPVDRHA